MWLVTFFRAGGFALQNVFRNFSLSLVTVLIMVVTVFSVNIVLVLQLLGVTALQSVQERIDVSLYLKQEVDEQAARGLQSYMRQLAQTESVDLLLRDRVLAQFQDRHAEEPSVMESLKALGDNPFGSVLIVRATEPQFYQLLIDTINASPYAQLIEKQDFEDHRQVIGKISNVTDRLRHIGIGITLLFLLITMLIVFNTIWIKLYTHQEEIGIMKLVGAGNWFIRMPFFIEGLIYAVLAVAAALGLFFSFADTLQPYVNDFFDGTAINVVAYFSERLPLLFAVEFGGLAVLTLIATTVAMRRYLKV